MHSLLEARAEHHRSDWFGRSPLLLASSTGDMGSSGSYGGMKISLCKPAYKDARFLVRLRESTGKDEKVSVYSTL